jgi:hypothetical protein
MTEPVGPLSLSEGLARRIAGPLRFRLVVQPLIAILFGIWDGFGDAKAGRPPYLEGVLLAAEHRSALLKTSLKRMAMPFTIGIILDAIIQWFLFHRVIVVGALIFGTLFIAIPYAAARGLTNRVVRSHYSKHQAAAVAHGKHS